MKLSDLSKATLIGAVALSLATLPVTLSASAQSSDTTGQGTSSVDTTNRDRHNDWGWLGLLGLAGLAGLRKRHDDSTVYREPDASTRPGMR
jgi:MYXO-CTERM domain-containing protein